MQNAINEILAGISVDEAIDALIEASSKAAYRRERAALVRKHGNPYHGGRSEQSSRDFGALKKKHGVGGATVKHNWASIGKSRFGITYGKKTWDTRRPGSGPKSAVRKEIRDAFKKSGIAKHSGVPKHLQHLFRPS